ncbi:MAG: hypothetical protein ACTSVC_09585, partial [Promethearchaeota archaeon]
IPVTLSVIDLPTLQADLKDIEFIFLGISLNKFKDIIIGNNDIIETINYYYYKYNNKIAKDIYFKGQNVSEEVWKKVNNIDKIEKIIKELKEKYEDKDIYSLNECISLKKKIEEKSYSDFIKKISNEEKKQNILNEYKLIQSRLKVQEIFYIPELKIIQSNIGMYIGINKFYDDNFIPHFEPNWKEKDNKKFVAYCYPYNTEGILIELNKLEIGIWLYQLDLISVKPNSIEQASEILLNMDSDIYNKVYTLLHTFSHILLKRISLFTGLDYKSCSEKIFPYNGAFLIFSQTQINIGALKYIFENFIIEWFENIKYDVLECPADPYCSEHLGKCFACLFLPEFVCCNFNRLLDRSSLISKSKKRFLTGFWGSV